MAWPSPHPLFALSHNCSVSCAELWFKNSFVIIIILTPIIVTIAAVSQYGYCFYCYQGHVAANMCISMCMRRVISLHFLMVFSAVSCDCRPC